MENYVVKKSIISHVTSKGDIIEMLYQPEDNHTTFARFISDENRIEYGNEIVINETETLIPFPADNNLLRNKVILLPSEVCEYETDFELIERVRLFIHKYLQVGELFEKIASYYVLFTWVYDKFNELPYLRSLGDYGTGKSRFLKVIGSLCYKPIFANGAITSAPIFRILQECHGTLILNEADFRISETWSDITKILNNGFEANFPVLRCEPQGKNKPLEIKSFDVFSPKILGARERFQDHALESRFITEEMETRDIRQDIPINLPNTFEGEALKLRNCLLKWRFKNYHSIRLNPLLAISGIEPRLNQIILPLCSIIRDEELIEDIKTLMQAMNMEILKDRGMSKEAEILEAIIRLQEVELCIEPTVKEIVILYNHGKSEKEQITARKMGGMLKKLGLRTERNRNGFYLISENMEKIKRLGRKYGIKDIESLENSQHSQNTQNHI